MFRIFSRRSPFSLPRIAEILLVCIFCIALCVGCLVQPASAVGTGATVAVAGGAIGTGGIPALGALGGLLTPTLGVIGAVLLGAGVNVYITEESAAQGMTKTQFIEQSLRNWVHERGGSFDDLIGTIADGIHVSPLGKISLTGAAGLLIYQFGNWLYSNDAVVSPPDAEQMGILNGWNYSYGSIYVEYDYNGYHYIVTYTSRDSDIPVLFFPFANNSSEYITGRIMPVTPSEYYDLQKIDIQQIRLPNYVDNYVLNMNRAQTNSNSCFYSGSGNSFAKDQIPWNATNVSFSCPANVVDDSFSSYFNNNIISWDDVLSGGSSLPADDVFTGTAADWTANRDLLKPGADDVIVVDNAPDLLGGAAQLLGAGDYVISVPDYLASIADAYNQALTVEAAVPVSLTDTATGVIVSDVVSVASPFADTALGSASDTTISASGALVAPDAEVGASEAIQVLTPDLTLIFPFCIPFDLARLLNLLSADPVIPRYHVSWEIAYLPNPIEFDIDLTPLDGVMGIVRVMETLLFIAGLALATRRVYLRG